MALDTYANLQAEIALWLNRQDLTARIPTFITLLEAQINRDLRVREMETRAYRNVTEEYTQLPSDYAGIKKLRLITDPPGRYLDLVGDADLDKILRDYAGTAGRPIAYAVIGNEIRVAPTPDATYEIEILYHARIPVLSDANTTNWVLEKHPDLYLYGSLMQAAPYLHNDERITVWDSGVSAILESLAVADQRARAGSAPRAMRFTPYGGSRRGLR